MTPEEWHAKALSGTLPDSACIRQTFSTDITVRESSDTADNPGRTISFVISTATPDRDKDVVMPGGVKLDNYLKNPVVLWSHDYASPPIGRALSITTDETRLMATAQFADAETYPFADCIYRLITQGFIRATSIGFRPTKYVLDGTRGGFDFQECELLEFSIVAVPANAEALALAAGVEGTVIDLAPIEAWMAQVKALAPVVIDSTPTPLTKADLDTALAQMSAQFDAAVREATAAGRIPLVEHDGVDPVFRLTFGDPEPTVCRLIDETEQTFAIDPEALRAVVSAVVTGSVTACVDRTVARVVAEARGRVV